jgi:5-formyltetrahydrofolate cyclo-ligase
LSHASPASAKTALRLFLRDRRKQLAQAHPEADAAVVDLARAPLAARFPDPAGKVAAIYHGFGSELAARPLGDWLAQQGWTLALPRVESDDRAMVFRLWAPGQDLTPDAIGLKAPDPDNEIVAPDLVITPLLAFDRSGARLGQGGGYYDKALAALREAGPVFVLGLAYAGQETPNLPREPHDQRLDAILTEKEYIDVLTSKDL